MASLQQETTGVFHIVFRFKRRRYKRSLATKNQAAAFALKSEIEETMDLLERGRIGVPESVDPIDFILAGGKEELLAERTSRDVRNETPVALTLKELFRRFFEAIPDENLEANTLCTMRTHEKHLVRLLKPRFPVQEVTGHVLQQYVNARAKEKAHYVRVSSHTKPSKRLVSPCTSFQYVLPGTRLAGSQCWFRPVPRFRLRNRVRHPSPNIGFRCNPTG